MRAYLYWPFNECCYCSNTESRKFLLIIYRPILIIWQLLESKIQEAKSKKDTLKARAQSAKYVPNLISLLNFHIAIYVS